MQQEAGFGIGHPNLDTVVESCKHCEKFNVVIGGRAKSTPKTPSASAAVMDVTEKEDYHPWGWLEAYSYNPTKNSWNQILNGKGIFFVYHDLPEWHHPKDCKILRELDWDLVQRPEMH